MKPLIRLAFLFSMSVFFGQTCFAQDDMVSTFKPRTKTEKLVFAKLKALPEIQEFYTYKIKGGKPDIVINPPDTFSKYYRFQVGVDYPNIFRTNYWLSIDPKTYKIYYWDFLDTADRDISLQQWRRWRNDPGFQDNHTWKNGKLMVIKYKKHVKKKSGRP